MEKGLVLFCICDIIWVCDVFGFCVVDDCDGLEEGGPGADGFASNE